MAWQQLNEKPEKKNYLDGTFRQIKFALVAI